MTDVSRRRPGFPPGPHCVMDAGGSPRPAGRRRGTVSRAGLLSQHDEAPTAIHTVDSPNSCERTM
jgi:hypothetical protein